jgi:hypothetical protein
MGNFRIALTTYKRSKNTRDMALTREHVHISFKRPASAPLICLYILTI